MTDVACGATPCDLATGRPGDLDQVGESASRQVERPDLGGLSPSRGRSTTRPKRPNRPKAQLRRCRKGADDLDRAVGAAVQRLCTGREAADGFRRIFFTTCLILPTGS